MKKQFFYAAMAVALMASCSSEDNLALDPVNPTPDEDKVALQLGIDAPSVSAEVGGRGTGSVGDVAGENNKWNNQQLFITMIDRATGNVAKDDQDKPILAWDSYEYIAPRAVDQTADDLKGNIRIYQKNTYSQTEAEADKGTIQYLYYPVSGKFDFYGWHLDGALTQDDANPAITATPETNDGEADGYPTITLSNIVIDGTQDIMAAKTTDRSSDETVTTNNLQTWLYSARAARNEVHPVLKFEHKLARLKFFVRAGSEVTALKNADNNYQGTDPIVTGDHSSTGAMYVTGIRALNMINTFDLTLDGTTTTATAADNATTAIFKLGDKLANGYTDASNVAHIAGQIDTLVAVAPEYPWKYAAKPADYKGTPVGESIMFLPEDDAATSISFQMDLKQYVQLTDDETTDGEDTYGYKTQTNAPFTVNATHVKTASGTNANAFKAGESYNVYITIYGFERIEVSAELTAWALGGDVDVDIEEGESSTLDDETTETVKATFNITGLAEGTEATVTLSNSESKKATANDQGVATVEFTVNKGVAYTYTVTAEGYENGTGELTSTETNSDTDVTKSVTMTAAQEAPTTKSVTFNIEGLAENQSATVKIGDTEKTYTYGGEAVVFDGLANEEVTYTITSATHFGKTGTIAADATTASVTLSTTKDFTIKVVNEGATNADVTVVKVDDKGNDGDSVSDTNDVFTLTFGQKYKYTASADGLTTKTETITANDELSASIDITLEAQR